MPNHHQKFRVAVTLAPDATSAPVQRVLATLHGRGATVHRLTFETTPGGGSIVAEVSLGNVGPQTIEASVGQLVDTLEVTVCRIRCAATEAAESVADADADAAVQLREVDPVFALHVGGKIRVQSSVRVTGPADLAMAYTPGVADVCTAIANEPHLADRYTWRSRTVAVVTDGSAVLGLGNLGALASLPVMEGKAMLFASLAGINAVPICLDEADPDALVETIVRLAPSFGGINLEDISAPRCFEIEKRLQELLDIPVFHDDQHGTAIVVLAGLFNAAELTGRELGNMRVVVSGAGAAGVAVSRMLLAAGVGDLVVLDRGGILHGDRSALTPTKQALARLTNLECIRGGLAEALAGADAFVGVSGGQVGEDLVARMAADSIVFALANPTPEIHPDVAARRAAVVATGRSDFPNQINNALAFPGVFHGALSCHAAEITDAMKLAAARALSALVNPDLSPTRIVPTVFDERVVPAVSRAVATAFLKEGPTELAREKSGRRLSRERSTLEALALANVASIP